MNRKAKEIEQISYIHGRTWKADLGIMDAAASEELRKALCSDGQQLQRGAV